MYSTTLPQVLSNSDYEYSTVLYVHLIWESVVPTSDIRSSTVVVYTNDFSCL